MAARCLLAFRMPAGTIRIVSISGACLPLLRAFCTLLRGRLIAADSNVGVTRVKVENAGEKLGRNALTLFVVCRRHAGYAARELPVTCAAFLR